MIKSACKRMKMAAVSSVGFIFVGSLLVLIAQQLSLETALPAALTTLGFFSILAGLLVMVITAVAIMLPSISRRLDLCQH